MPSNTEISRNSHHWPRLGCARVDIPTARKSRCWQSHNHSLYTVMLSPESPLHIGKEASWARKTGWDTASYVAPKQITLHRIVTMGQIEIELWTDQSYPRCQRSVLRVPFAYMHLFCRIRSKADFRSQHMETAWVCMMVWKNSTFWNLIKGTAIDEFAPFCDKYPY